MQGPMYNINDSLAGAKPAAHMNQDQFMPPNELGPNFKGPDDMRSLLRTRQVYQGVWGANYKAEGTYDAPKIINTPKG